MLRNRGNVDDDVAEQKFRETVHERPWVIPNWPRGIIYEHNLRPLTFVFETGHSTQVETTWLVFFNMCKRGNRFRVHWKLLDAKGFPDNMVQATLNTTLLKSDSSVDWTDTQKLKVKIGQDVQMPNLLGACTVENEWRHRINSNGEVVFKLKLILMAPYIPSVDLRMEDFHKASQAKLCANLTGLLNDESTSDLKIITSDEKELLAHKAILKVQCPVFESMFRSEYQESKSGIVNVKDVAAKTMQILLHYLYSGELLPTWKDEDTIVEFTYAVGKYQLENVLKLLDEVLGSRDEENASHTDIQLLDLAQRLGLKAAEMELVERIKKTTSKVDSGAELFAILGIGRE